MKKIYISLPITNEGTAKAREKADLSHQGWKVISPFEICPETNPSMCFKTHGIKDFKIMYER